MSSSKRKGKSNRDYDFVKRSSRTLGMPISVNDSVGSNDDIDDEDDVEIIAPLGATIAGPFQDLPRL